MQALLVSVPLVAPLPGAGAAAPAVPAAVLPLAAAPEVEIEVAVEPGAMVAVILCSFFWALRTGHRLHASQNSS